MKIGDSIYVTAGRDKDRGATLVELDYVNRTARVDYGGGHIIPVDYSCIRPMVQEKVATKHDTEKNRLELIPASALEALGRAMTYGSRKYDDHNWANGFEWDRLVGSLMRHLNAWRAGQDNDPESGLSHIDHVLANAAMLASHIEEGLGNDNRRKTIS